MPIKPQTDSSRPLCDGLILAGGQAKRFAGRPKGLVQFRGRPMVGRVAEMLHSKVSRLMISANHDQAAYEPYADLIIADQLGDQWGPLAGIYTGLKRSTANWLLVATCDQPLLPADYSDRMIKLIDDDKSLIMAIDAERQHFLNLLIPTSFADNLYQFLLGGERSAHRWLETVNCRTVEFPLGSLDSINSQTELERSEAKIDPIH